MELKELPVEVEPQPGDDFCHFTCESCDPEGTLTLCGLDATDKEELPDDGLNSVDCVVCNGINYCPVCGVSFVPSSGLLIIFDELTYFKENHG